jgi:hypothetical protein
MSNANDAPCFTTLKIVTNLPVRLSFGMIRAGAEDGEGMDLRSSTCESGFAIGRRYSGETHKVSHLAEQFVVIAV